MRDPNKPDPKQAARDAWEGFDLLTLDGGINPLIASYSGAPHQIRGVDPHDYAQAAAAFWGGTPDPVSIIPSLPDLPGVETAKKIGVGLAGGVLALLVVAFGLFVLVKD